MSNIEKYSSSTKSKKWKKRRKVVREIHILAEYHSNPFQMSIVAKYTVSKCMLLTFVTMSSLTAYTNDDAADDDNHEQKSSHSCYD